MQSATRPALIAALCGRPGSEVETVLTAFARRRQAEGVAVAGVIAPTGASARLVSGPDGNGCSGRLIDLATGATFDVRQNLGSGSQACSIDSQALADVCGGAERAIFDGAELVVLNRFGCQEVAHGGLLAAYQAAVAAGLPIACMVAPPHADTWERFSEGLASWLPADDAALDAWWRQHSAARAGRPDERSAQSGRV